MWAMIAPDRTRCATLKNDVGKGFFLSNSDVPGARHLEHGKEVDDNFSPV
jgi:hypothetical protein